MGRTPPPREHIEGKENHLQGHVTEDVGDQTLQNIMNPFEANYVRRPRKQSFRLLVAERWGFGGLDRFIW